MIILISQYCKPVSQAFSKSCLAGSETAPKKAAWLFQLDKKIKNNEKHAFLEYTIMYLFLESIQ